MFINTFSIDVLIEIWSLSGKASRVSYSWKNWEFSTWRASGANTNRKRKLWSFLNSTFCVFPANALKINLLTVNRLVSKAVSFTNNTQILLLNCFERVNTLRSSPSYIYSDRRKIGDSIEYLWRNSCDGESADISVRCNLYLTRRWISFPVYTDRISAEKFNFTRTATNSYKIKIIW